MRLDGASLRCEDVIAVHPDGGAAILCTFVREDACGIRQVGPDGEERGRSELVPGWCRRWAPRPEGGGVLVTSDAREQTLTFTNLDASGKRGASTSFTSKGRVFDYDTRITSDGGVITAIGFSWDLVHRGKRLGKTDHTVSGLVKLAPKLDRLQWSRLFGTRRTSIIALLPATAPGGFEAILQTRGPLVPGAPVNPSVDPSTGMFGGDTYGWRAERVAFDRRGTSGAREDLGSGPNPPLHDAAVVDGRLVTLARDPKVWQVGKLTMIGSDGDREQRDVNLSEHVRLTEISGRTWILECDCAFDPARGKRSGTWTAHEVGGARAKVVLGDAETRQWFSVAMSDERAVAVGSSAYGESKIPITVTALGHVPPAAPTLDITQLAPVDRLGLPAECGGKGHTYREQLARVVALDASLEACGIPPKANVQLKLFFEGGIETLSIKDASPEVLACARHALEPTFRCPTIGGRVFSFTARR